MIKDILYMAGSSESSENSESPESCEAVAQVEWK